MLKKRSYMVLMIVIIFFSLCYPVENITIKSALKYAINNSKKLMAIKESRKAGKALIDQAQKIPNPELEIELENLGISEIGIGIGQTFERGHKKESRVSLSIVSSQVPDIEYKKYTQELETHIIQSIIPILSAQHKISLIDSIIVMAMMNHMSIKKRVIAGAAMETDSMRSELEIDHLILERESILKEIVLLKKVLLGIINDTTIVFDKVDEEFSDQFNIPALDVLVLGLKNNYDYLLGNKSIEISDAEIAVAKSDAYTDFSLSASFIRNNESKENVGVLGFSVELPLFNKNKGTIKAKELRKIQVNYSNDNVLTELVNELTEQYYSFQNISKKINLIENRIIPKIVKVYDKLYSYYTKSQASIFEVIETQEELLETKMDILELKTEKAQICSEIIGICGIPITIFK